MGEVPGRGPETARAVKRTSDRVARGKWAEDVAVRHLTEHGLVCRDRNFRSRYGEIDLVMEDRGVLVFVEVRSRSRRRFMHPAESVDGSKRARIARTADTWLRVRNRAPTPPCRFDVVAVTGGPGDPRGPLAAGCVRHLIRANIAAAHDSGGSDDVHALAQARGPSRARLAPRRMHHGGHRRFGGGGRREHRRGGSAHPRDHGRGTRASSGRSAAQSTPRGSRRMSGTTSR